MYQTYDALDYPFFGERHVDLSDLLGADDLEVCVAPLKARRHNITAFELLALAALTKEAGSNLVFEIGTYDGRTARALAMNLSGENGMVYTLNLPPETESVSLKTDPLDVGLASKVASGERFLLTPQDKRIEQLWGDSATFDFMPYQKRMDLVFIDGAHSESYARSDTQNSIKLIKPSGGLITWHDAHRYGVRKFLQEWIRENDYPVYFIRNTSLAVMGVRDGRPFDFRKDPSTPVQ